MAPRKKQPRRARGGAAQRLSPLEALPPELLAAVGRRLVTQDKLNNILTAARDIASLAQASKTMAAFAEGTLWGLLGQQYTAEGSSGAALSAVPKAEQYEQRHMATKVRKLVPVPKPKVLAQKYEEEVPSCVPSHIFSEFMRLSCLGTAGSNAKKEFLLTDGDLREVPHVEKSRGALGTAHVYALGDLLVAARAKHGSPEGLVRHGAAKVAKAEQRKRSAEGKVDQRRRALAQALEPLGGQLSDFMCTLNKPAAYLKGGKGAPSVESMLPYLQLVDWCEKNGANFSGVRDQVLHSESRWLSYKIMYREEMEGGGYYGGSYFAAADKAAAELDQGEEEDCVCLACQSWAQRHGGVEAALQRPEVPQEGPLAALLRCAMRQKVLSMIREYVDECSFPGEIVDYSDEEGGAEESVATGWPSSFFEQYQEFVQVEVTAASQEDLQAWERRVLCKLRKLARLLHYPSNLGDQVSAQACLRAFRRDAPAADGGPPHLLSLLFVGVARKQEPTSLLRVAPASKSSRGPQENLEPSMETFKKHLMRWSERQPGMELKLCHVKAGEVPQWVREAAAAAAGGGAQQQQQQQQQQEQKQDEGDEQQQQQ